MTDPRDSAPPGGSVRERFAQWRGRGPGGPLAGFVLEVGRPVELLSPQDMQPMTPARLLARMKGKGVAGTFEKGDGGVRFTVLAAKAGGAGDQPWVTAALRAELGVTTLEIVEEAPARPIVNQADPLDGLDDLAALAGDAPGELGGLDLLGDAAPSPPTGPDAAALQARLTLAWDAGRRAIRAWGRAAAADPDLEELPELDARLRLLEDLLPSPAPALEALTALAAAAPDQRGAARARALQAVNELLVALDDDRLELLESNSLAPAGAVPPIEAALLDTAAALT
jgi:hypothetical protein